MLERLPLNSVSIYGRLGQMKLARLITSQELLSLISDFKWRGFGSWGLRGHSVLVAAIIGLGMLADAGGGGFFIGGIMAAVLPLFDSSPVTKEVQIAFCQYRLQFLSALVLKCN